MTEQPVRTIEDEATLRVIADPLRRRILLHLGEGRSIGDVARLLEVTPQRLYYHFRLLETHGFIAGGTHRQKGNHVERLYTRVAATIRIEPGLARDVGYGVHLGIQTVLEESAIRYAQARRDLEATGSVDNFPNLQMIVMGRLSPKRARELGKRLKAVVSEFIDDDPKGVRYGVTLVVHPAGPHPDEPDAVALGESDRS